MSNKTAQPAFLVITPDMIVEGIPGMDLYDYFFSEQTAAIIQSLMLRHNEPDYLDTEAIDQSICLANYAANQMIQERDKQLNKQPNK